MEEALGFLEKHGVAVAVALFCLALTMRGLRRQDRSAADRSRDAAASEEAFRKLPADVQSDVDRLIRSRKSIEAIKRVREASGLDLKASKAVVDARAGVLGA